MQFMKKNVDDLYSRFDKMMDAVFSGSLKIDQENYPNRLEKDIQIAISKKRDGFFETAIDIYLNIFERERRIYPAIMEFLYKSVICTGRLDFAYECIAYGEAFAKKCWGPRSWMGPWSQETKRREFEDVLVKCHELPTTFISSGEPSESQIKQMTNNLLKRGQILEELMSRYSGGARVTVPSNVEDYLNRCYNMAAAFRQNRIIQ